jgi:hypothetical protein
MTQFINGTFFDVAMANKAVDELVAAGRSRSDVSVILSSDTHHRFWDAPPCARAQAPNSGKGGGRDIASGGAIGTILADSAQNDATATRVVGSGTGARFVVFGLAAAAMADDGRGSSSSGDTLRALARILGIPQHGAEQLERDLGSGAIAVVVKAGDGDRTSVSRILRGNETRNVLESLSAG